MTHPIPEQIYRHRKHNPDAGHWHEYKVIGVVRPWPAQPTGDPRTHWHFPDQYRHTDTEKLMTLTGCRDQVYADVAESHVAYKNTRPDLCSPEWVHCLRPLTEFVDGRFRLVG